jgi:bifunctional DNA-binding transcriptional regulator/antitoxin component of YhaV-PrlF toxin-antitoxin module
MDKQERDMPKVLIHGNQLTLPDDLRQALGSADDELLDAEEVDEGILLRRSPAARRKAGLADLRVAQGGVRYAGPEPRPSADEEEQQIADLLAAAKAAERSQEMQ